VQGKITGTFSEEEVNNAPVVVTIETDEGPQTVIFQRQYWNDFFDAHADRINDPDFRVTVEGEPYQQTVRCNDDDCCPDPGVELVTCVACCSEVPREEALFCNGYDDEDPDGCHAVACTDCAALVFDGAQNCTACHEDA